MKEKAYIAGVLHGDGYCTVKGFGVTAADKDFVEAFAKACSRVYGTKATVGPDKTYWRFYKGNASGRFSSAKHYEPVTVEEKAIWLRGLFDSEGNAQLATGVGAKGYTHRRVSIYSTEPGTLTRAGAFLSDLEIGWRFRLTKNSEGHIGDKTVYELALRGEANFILFRDLVGSSIARKRGALDAIVASYLTPEQRHAVVLEFQAKGAQKKRERTQNETIPGVVRGIREMMDRGEKPTQRNCRAIPGYNTIQGRFSQRVLVEMAEAL